MMRSDVDDRTREETPAGATSALSLKSFFNLRKGLFIRVGSSTMQSKGLRHLKNQPGNMKEEFE
jgi:hypothetical protein